MKPYVIGICGGSGSGKTTFIKRLRERFDISELCIVSQDDYYLPRDKQYKDHNDEYNFDLPKSFDKKKFRSDLKSLIRGETVTVEEYTFNNPDAKPKLLVFQPAPIIVIEGLFVFHYKKNREPARSESLHQCKRKPEGHTSYSPRSGGAGVSYRRCVVQI